MSTTLYCADVSSATIDDVAMTSDTLTGRGGLAVFVRYLKAIGIAPHLDRLLGSIRKSRKGRPVVEIFVQLFCYFVDGSSRHLTYFDTLASDKAYAACIHTTPDRLQSSHAIKRFFYAFSAVRTFLFRRLLQRLFLWRLHKEKPAVIELGLDTTVFDNSDAMVRHGVQPTYRKSRGFQPLILTSGPYVVDALLRGGSKHGNQGKTVARMIYHVVRRIRRGYGDKTPIVLRCDSGFFDQKLFAAFEELGIGYVVAGKRYDNIKTFVEQAREHGDLRLFRKDKQTWGYVEFADKRGSWSRFRRAVYTWLIKDDQQLIMPFAASDRVYYTNLGMGGVIDQALEDKDQQHWLTTRHLISWAHGRGRDELVNRAIKDFASEKLPFKRFVPNMAWFYTMLVSFVLYESFKRDVAKDIIPVTCYPTTFRRLVIDIAAKIVRHAGKVTLKVTQATWQQLHMATLWLLAEAAPTFTWGR